MSEPTEPTEPTEPSAKPPKPKGLLNRLAAMERRTVLLLCTGALLIIVLVFFDGCSGIEVSQEDAEATALAAFEATPGAFEHERMQTQMLRRGVPPNPVWAVVFSIPDPEGSRGDYLRQGVVMVDARTGDVLEVNLDSAADG